LSFGEGFEGATFPPTGWTIQTTGAPGQYAWARTTSTYYVATGAGAAFVGGGDPTAKDEYLISPAISLGAGDTGLQFNWIGNRNFSSEVDVQLLARPSGGGSWTTLWALSNEPYGNAFTAKSFALQVSPNPMQSRATISGAFRQAVDGQAKLSIADVQGRRVLWRNIPLSRGRATWQWDRSDAGGSRVSPAFT
jgi:hypothetical protein